MYDGVCLVCVFPFNVVMILSFYFSFLVNVFGVSVIVIICSALCHHFPWILCCVGDIGVSVHGTSFFFVQLW